MSKKIESAVERLVLPVVTELGYEYIDTEVKKVGDEFELIIYADKKGGLDLQDCEKISRAIDPLIEEADPIEEGYYLCVSSPGLDRPLKTKADYQRSLDKTVDVKLYKTQEGSKTHTGQLISYDNDGFTLRINDEDKVFMYKDTAIIRLHVDI
jgi:ribosome maturation factor RimP